MGEETPTPNKFDTAQGGLATTLNEEWVEKTLAWIAAGPRQALLDDDFKDYETKLKAALTDKPAPQPS